MASEKVTPPTATEKATKKDPAGGLSPEEWVKLWDTDFAELGRDHHHHKHSEHGDDSHSRLHRDEQHTCGSEKYVKRYLPRMVRDKGTISILVTLCGNTPDIEFLARQGHDVTGIEISEVAVKGIFEKSAHGPIPYDVVTKGNFKVFSATDGKKITVYVGNFFSLTADLAGPFDAVWDAHGIISIPEASMLPYANKLKELLKPDGVLLFSTVNYDLFDLAESPPVCPVSTKELHEFFPEGFEIELLENPDFHGSKFKGVTNCTNPIHLISSKTHD